MNISGIRPNERIYSYNATRLNELKSQQIAATRKEKSLREEENVKPVFMEEYQQNLHQTYDSYDYAQEYRPNESYDLKGIDTDINKLDVEKAISDMDMDKVLQQYQYFVGDEARKQLQQQNATEMALRSGENFIL